MTERSRSRCCPGCGSENTVVIFGQDSRLVQGAYRRRRECRACDHRWTTIEIPADGYEGIIAKMNRNAELISIKCRALVAEIAKLTQDMDGAGNN